MEQLTPVCAVPCCLCPGVFGMAAGTMSETKHCEQGSQWGLQASLSRNWSFPECVPAAGVMFQYSESHFPSWAHPSSRQCSIKVGYILTCHLAWTAEISHCFEGRAQLSSMGAVLVCSRSLQCTHHCFLTPQPATAYATENMLSWAVL